MLDGNMEALEDYEKQQEEYDNRFNDCYSEALVKFEPDVSALVKEIKEFATEDFGVELDVEELIQELF